MGVRRATGAACRAVEVLWLDGAKSALPGPEGTFEAKKSVANEVIFESGEPPGDEGVFAVFKMLFARVWIFFNGRRSSLKILIVKRSSCFSVRKTLFFERMRQI